MTKLIVETDNNWTKRKLKMQYIQKNSSSERHCSEVNVK